MPGPVLPSIRPVLKACVASAQAAGRGRLLILQAIVQERGRGLVRLFIPQPLTERIPVAGALELGYPGRDQTDQTPCPRAADVLMRRQQPTHRK